MTAVFEDEVVTVALVRYLRVPRLAGELALITLDNGQDHTRPSTFGPGGLASLDAALDEIEARSPAPVAIGVTGKPFIFAVGADLSGVRLMTQLSRQFAERPDVRYGLTAMCIGIGMGGTVIWENPAWEGADK